MVPLGWPSPRCDGVSARRKAGEAGIWIGDLEPLFLLEIAFRTFVIFVWPLLLLRMLGTRGVKRLSFFEVTIIIGLGSAVGDPMIHDDVPLLRAMVAIAVIVGMYRGVMFIVRKDESFQRFVEVRQRASCATAVSR